MPIVKEEIHNIWQTFFNQDLPRARAWSLATKSTQNLLIQVRKEVTAHRLNRLEKLQRQLKDQEATTSQDSVQQTRVELKRKEEIALKRTKLFTREWWTGKIDRPSSEKFKMLKVKQRQEHLPLLIDENGLQATSQDDNKNLISEYYQKIFQEDNLTSSSKTSAMRAVKKTRQRTVSDQMTAQLEQSISKEEIK